MFRWIFNVPLRAFNSCRWLRLNGCISWLIEPNVSPAYSFNWTIYGVTSPYCHMCLPFVDAPKYCIHQLLYFVSGSCQNGMSLMSQRFSMLFSYFSLLCTTEHMKITWESIRSTNVCAQWGECGHLRSVSDMSLEYAYWCQHMGQGMVSYCFRLDVSVWGGGAKSAVWQLNCCAIVWNLS